MSKQVKEFIFNGAGTVTLQLTTIGALFILAWNISAWKSDIEHKIEDTNNYRWSSLNMGEWTWALASWNPKLTVPSSWDYVEEKKEKDG
jgi:hypothetical protein